LVRRKVDMPPEDEPRPEAPSKTEFLANLSGTGTEDTKRAHTQLTDRKTVAEEPLAVLSFRKATRDRLMGVVRWR